MQIVLRAVLLLAAFASGLCLFPLEIRSKKIKKIQLESSRSTLNTAPDDARWDSQRAWCVYLETKPKKYIYLEVDLGKEYDITKIKTMGWPAMKKKIRNYVLHYKKNGQWVSYRERLRIKVFKGDFCHSSVVPLTSSLKEPIITQHIRLYPFSKVRETGCLRLEIYGSEPVHSDCARVGTKVMVKNTRDRPISFLPGRIAGFSKYHVFVRVENRNEILGVNKDENYALVLDKKIKRGALKRNDKVLALFRYWDRFYMSSVLFTSLPPGHGYIQNEAFYSPSEWVKEKYLRSYVQAYLCHCDHCEVSSSLEEARNQARSPYDFGILLKTIKMTQENEDFQYLLGQVEKVILNKQRTSIREGETQSFRFKPKIINSCLCPYLKAATSYFIFGFIKDGKLLIDSTSFVKEKVTN